MNTRKGTGKKTPGGAGTHNTGSKTPRGELEHTEATSLYRTTPQWSSQLLPAGGKRMWWKSEMCRAAGVRTAVFFAKR